MQLQVNIGSPHNKVYVDVVCVTNGDRYYGLTYTWWARIDKVDCNPKAISAYKMEQESAYFNRIADMAGCGDSIEQAVKCLIDQMV